MSYFVNFWHKTVWLIFQSSSILMVLGNVPMYPYPAFSGFYVNDMSAK